MEFDSAKKYILDKLTRDLPKQLTYHSVGHIKDVYHAAENLAELEQIPAPDKKLLLTAVLFHDSGFLRSNTDHEQHSCDIVRESLPGYAYSPEEIERICSMIMATKIPQSPNNRLEQIICDADLDYLGREDFPAVGRKLYDELCRHGMISSEEEWFQLQSSFLSSHQYFTPSAIRLRKEKKGEHLKQIQSILKNNADKWDQPAT